MDVTLLKAEEIWGSTALDVIKKYGARVAPTDLAILLGCSSDPDTLTIEKNQSCFAFSKSLEPDSGKIISINTLGVDTLSETHDYYLGVRPVLPPSETNKINRSYSKTLTRGVSVYEYGEYPRISADISVPDLIQCVDKLKKKKSFLIIWGMDSISAEEQKKFIPLLKDRQILSSKLPEKVQIIILTKKLKAISSMIKSITFHLKVS